MQCYLIKIHLGFLSTFTACNFHLFLLFNSKNVIAGETKSIRNVGRYDLENFGQLSSKRASRRFSRSDLRNAVGENRFSALLSSIFTTRFEVTLRRTPSSYLEGNIFLIGGIFFFSSVPTENSLGKMC